MHIYISCDNTCQKLTKSKDLADNDTTYELLLTEKINSNVFLTLPLLIQ